MGMCLPCLSDWVTIHIAMSIVAQHIVVGIILACVAVWIVVRIVRLIKGKEKLSACNCMGCDVADCALRDKVKKTNSDCVKKSAKNIA